MREALAVEDEVGGAAPLATLDRARAGRLAPLMGSHAQAVRLARPRSMASQGSSGPNRSPMTGAHRASPAEPWRSSHLVPG